MKETAMRDVLVPQVDASTLHQVSENQHLLNAIEQHLQENDLPGHPISDLGRRLHSARQVYLRSEQKDQLPFRLHRQSPEHGKAGCSRVRRIFYGKTDSYTMRRPRLPAGGLYQKVLHPLAPELFLRGSISFHHGELKFGA